MSELNKDFVEPMDSPAYRIGAQVHDHEARIRLLERDSADIKKTLDAMNYTIENFVVSINTKFAQMELHIHDALMKHELAEFANQKKIMASLFTILLSVIGSCAYLIIQHLWRIP